MGKLLIAWLSTVAISGYIIFNTLADTHTWYAINAIFQSLL